MANTNDSPPITRALANIETWAKGWPEWQQDALHRIYTRDALSDADKEELLSICRGKIKAKNTFQSQGTATSNVSKPVTLCSIGDIEGVNALASKQSLSFAQSGLTVIYGDNGSGKSGYTRILKNACRSRHTDAKIYSNVHEPETSPKARLHYAIDANKEEITWTPGNTDPHLKQVSIFDSKAANVHVNENNEVAYTPLPIKMLKELAIVCDYISVNLKDERAKLCGKKNEKLARFSSEQTTAVGAIIAELMQGKSPEKRLCALKSQIETLAKLDEEAIAEEKKLKSDLDSGKEKAKNLATSNAGLDAHIKAMKQLDAKTNQAAFDSLKELATAYKDAKQAAKAAANASFGKETFQIDSAAWQNLWAAARAFSTEIAYPDGNFPVTDKDAQCVLCQQALDADAKSRLQRFEQFVQDETKKKEGEAKEAYEKALQQLKDVRFSLEKCRDFCRCLREDFEDEDMANRIWRGLAQSYQWIKKVIRASSDNLNTLDRPALAWPVEALDAKHKKTADKIDELKQGEQAEGFQKKKQALAELKDKHWLSQNKAKVLEAVGLCVEIDRIKTAISTTQTNTITRKNSDISKQLVESALSKRFAEELQKTSISASGLASLSLELSSRGAKKGSTRFGLALENPQHVKLGEVLSEGELHHVAMAVFFAELATEESRSAIVFDDPVSSLDYRYRDKMADRLTEEAAIRQVIVFTHNVEFVRLLKSKKTKPAFRQVSYEKKQAGVASEHFPLEVQGPWQKLQGMIKHLTNIKCSYPDWGTVRQLEGTRNFADELRGVMELAMHKIVQPVVEFDSGRVHVTRLSKLTVITECNAKVLADAYCKLNPYHHGKDNQNPFEWRDMKCLLDDVAEHLSDIHTNQQHSHTHSS